MIQFSDLTLPGQAPADRVAIAAPRSRRATFTVTYSRVGGPSEVSRGISLCSARFTSPLTVTFCLPGCDLGAVRTAPEFRYGLPPQGGAR